MPDDFSADTSTSGRAAVGGMGGLPHGKPPASVPAPEAGLRFSALDRRFRTPDHYLNG